MKPVILLVALVTLATAQGWVAVAPLPAPRYSGCAVALDGKVWYLGGSVTGGQKTNSVFIYDPLADTWTVGDSMPVARHRFGAAVLDGRIYAFGGWGNGGVLLNSAEVYDTATRQWTFIESLPTPRASHGGAAAAGKVWSIGGRNSTATIGRLDAFDPGTGQWLEHAPMLTPRCEAEWSSGSEFVGALGGTDHLGVTIFDDVEFYDTGADTWYAFPPMPNPRAAAGAFNTGRDFYVVGGWAPDAQLADNLLQFDAWQRVWSEGDSLSVARAFLAAACVEPWLFAIGGLASGQPVALVERIERPLAIGENPSLTPSALCRTHLLRPGSPLPGQAGENATLVSADGRAAARVTAGAPCPALAPGVWFLCSGADRARIIIVP